VTAIFSSKAAVFGSEPKRSLVFRVGAPVRVLGHVYPLRGKCKGRVTGVEKDAHTGKVWVRITLTKAPARSKGYLGLPFHLAASRLRLLPSKGNCL